MTHWTTWIATAAFITALVVAQSGCARLSRTTTTDPADRDAGYSASPAIPPDLIESHPSEQAP